LTLKEGNLDAAVRGSVIFSGDPKKRRETVLATRPGGKEEKGTLTVKFPAFLLPWRRRIGFELTQGKKGGTELTQRPIGQFQVKKMVKTVHLHRPIACWELKERRVDQEEGGERMIAVRMEKEKGTSSIT